MKFHEFGNKNLPLFTDTRWRQFLVELSSSKSTYLVRKIPCYLPTLNGHGENINLIMFLLKGALEILDYIKEIVVENCLRLVAFLGGQIAIELCP